MKSSRNANDKQTNWKNGHSGGKPEVTASDRRRLNAKETKDELPYQFTSRCVRTADGIWRQVGVWE